jgi:autotransporter-associated beta strand protein
MTASRGVTLGGGAAGTSAGITASSGTLTLTGALTYNGNIANDNGASFSGGNVSFGTSVSTMTINDSSAAAVDFTLSSTIVPSAGGFTKAGTGIMLLQNAANGYSGATTVSAGTLRLAGGGAIGDLSAVSITSGALLDLNGTSETIGSLGGGTTAGNISLGSATLTTGGNGNNTTYGGVISGGGAVVKTGAGVMTLAGANNYTGGTTVNNGAVLISSNGNLGGAAGGVTLTSGGALRFGATTSIGTRPVSLSSGSGVVDSNGFDATIAGSISGGGSLTKAGAGTLVVSSTGNGYSGGTSLTGGALQFAALSSLGSGGITFNGGGLKYRAPADGGNTSDISTRTITLASSDVVTNTIDTNGNNVTFNNAIGNNGTGHLIKAGAGTLTLNAAGTYTGETRSYGGTLLLNQSLKNSPSVRAIGGTIKLGESADGNRMIKTGPNQKDFFEVSSGGKIDLMNNKALVPVSAVIDSATYTDPVYSLGNWNNVSRHYTGLTGLIQNGRNGGAWNGSGIMTSEAAAANGVTGIAIGKASALQPTFPSFGDEVVNSGDLLLMYTYVGDANFDGIVDGDDYSNIDNGFAANRKGYVNGDFDYSGKIDADDYWYIDRNYGKQYEVSLIPSLPVDGNLSGVGAVPEPASIALVGLAAVGALRRRRRN